MKSQAYGLLPHVKITDLLLEGQRRNLGPCGGFGQWNQRSPRLNVRNGPFLEVIPKRTVGYVGRLTEKETLLTDN